MQDVCIFYDLIAFFLVRAQMCGSTVPLPEMVLKVEIIAI